MAQHQHGKSWTERAATDGYPQAQDYQRSYGLEHHAHAQGFKNAHTSLGVAGHIVHMTGVFVPVLAGELVQSPEKYKKVVRLASIGTALAYETLYAIREAKRREHQEAKLAECRSQAGHCER